MKTPRPSIVAVIVLMLFVSFPISSFAKENTGSLSVYSKVGKAKVYVDNDFEGETPVEIEEIQTGTHLISATQNDEIIYEEVVKIKEGEVTTIVITEDKAKQTIDKSDKSVADNYSDSPLIRGGPYLKIGFMSSLIYSLDYGDAFYSSGLGLGGGYKICFLPSYDMPSVDLVLSVERGDFVSGGDRWLMMPIGLGLNFNYPIIPGFGGKQYMSIGLSYIITDIRVGGEELSTIGYSIVPYGIEFPVSDDGTAFVETHSTYAENGKHKFALESFSIGGGFRWMF